MHILKNTDVNSCLTNETFLKNASLTLKLQQFFIQNFFTAVICIMYNFACPKSLPNFANLHTSFILWNLLHEFSEIWLIFAVSTLQFSIFFWHKPQDQKDTHQAPINIHLTVGITAAPIDMPRMTMPTITTHNCLEEWKIKWSHIDRWQQLMEKSLFFFRFILSLLAPDIDYNRTTLNLLSLQVLLRHDNSETKPKLDPMLKQSNHMLYKLNS